MKILVDKCPNFKWSGDNSIKCLVMIASSNMKALSYAMAPKIKTTLRNTSCQDLTEVELLEILRTLENDEMLEEIESQIQAQDNVEDLEQLEEVIDTEIEEEVLTNQTVAGDAQRQSQDQNQQVLNITI